jgi:hypothetical protein
MRELAGLALVLVVGTLAACVRLGWHRQWLDRWHAWREARRSGRAAKRETRP